MVCIFFSSRRRHTMSLRDWSSDVCSSDLILHEGQTLLVQVIKDPIGTKGARLSTQLSLAGRLLVYLPQDSHIGISQRIEIGRASCRERVKQRARAGIYKPTKQFAS